MSILRWQIKFKKQLIPTILEWVALSLIEPKGRSDERRQFLDINQNSYPFLPFHSKTKPPLSITQWKHFTMVRSFQTWGVLWTWQPYWFIQGGACMRRQTFLRPEDRWRENCILVMRSELWIKLYHSPHTPQPPRRTGGTSVNVSWWWLFGKL